MGREQGGDLVDHESSRSRGAQVPGPGIGDEQRLGLVEVAGEGPREHRGEPAGHHDAHVPARSQSCGGRLERLTRIVDVLEHAMTDHEVERCRRDVLGKVAGVADDSSDTPRRVEVGLGSPPVE
jgi:hypothetical protein